MKRYNIVWLQAVPRRQGTRNNVKNSGEKKKRQFGGVLNWDATRVTKHAKRNTPCFGCRATALCLQNGIVRSQEQILLCRAIAFLWKTKLLKKYKSYESMWPAWHVREKFFQVGFLFSEDSSLGCSIYLASFGVYFRIMHALTWWDHLRHFLVCKLCLRVQNSRKAWVH